MVTEITVRPTTSLSRPEKPIFGVYTPGDTDKGSMDDVAKAVNPLHYVPFVSQLYESATGNTGSAAMKIMGGAILGGPLGFLAGLASAIFEQETGKTIVASIADAISGEDSPVQVASSTTTATPISEGLRGVDTDTKDITPPSQISALEAQQKMQQAQMQMASATASMGNPISTQDREVLDLFGGQPASAHNSYKKAQMLPYLRDVTTSQVI